MTTKFTVNRNEVVSEAPPSTPLLYVLRNELRLTAARFGCGDEDCGACTILVDGMLAFSCTFLVSDAEGREIETVEGLTGRLATILRHELAGAGATQCGYCLSGIFVTACELLRRNPHPSQAEVRSALSRHLCRCGAHASILRAIDRSVETFNHLDLLP